VSGPSFGPGITGIQSKTANYSIIEVWVVENPLIVFGDVILALQYMLKHRIHNLGIILFLLEQRISILIQD
jgi:hypothetical protein